MSGPENEPAPGVGPGAVNGDDIATVYFKPPKTEGQVSAVEGDPTPIDKYIRQHLETAPLAARYRIARNLTDLGNSERFIDDHGDYLLYNTTSKKWLFYDGTRFREDEHGYIHHLARLTIRAIYGEAAREGSEEGRKRIARWATLSESATRIRSLLDLAKNDPVVTVVATELDADNWLLNTLSGTIDLKTGGLRHHRKEDRITKIAPVHFDPTATAPRWTQFLQEVLDQETAFYVQALSGLCLTGQMEPVFPVPYGVGENGKSVLFGTLRGLLGEYAGEVSPDTLMESKGGDGGKSATPELASTYGKRLILATESRANATLNQSLIKLYNGGERIVARYLHANPFSFQPTAKIFLITNHKPEIPNGGRSIWRRVRLIPFTRIIPAERRDPQLIERLKEEWPGILNWCLRGLEVYLEKGLPESSTVMDATGKFESDQDGIRAFLADETVEGYRVQAGRLYARYRKWCEREGEHALSSKIFRQAMEERGYRHDRQKMGRFYYNLNLAEGDG